VATRLHVWDGSKFVPAKEILVWNGSSWSPTREGYFWDGSKWVPIIEYRRWYYESGTEHVPWVIDNLFNDASARKNDTHLYLYTYAPQRWPYGTLSQAIFSTAVAVDLSGLSTLYIDWSQSASHDGRAHLRVLSRTGTGGLKILSKNGSFSRRVDALDVSDLRKDVPYYLEVFSEAWSTPFESASSTVRVYNVYAE